MNSIEDICDKLRIAKESPSIIAIEEVLEKTDKQAAALFANMSANDVFDYRDARKGAQSRLNRLRAARDRA